MRAMRGLREWAVPAIIVMAAAIRLYHLGRPSFEIDEATSYRIATMPIGAMWHLILTRETNRGLFYAFLRLWITIFGSSETALRMPSAIASVVTVLLIYRAGVRLFGERAGVLAALLLALSPVSVAWARDTTGYALELMFVTAGLLFLLRALERPSAGNQAGWALCDALAVFAHTLAIAAVPAQLIPLLLLDRRDVPWRRLLIAAAPLMLGVAPVLGVIGFVVVGHHNMYAWIPALSWPVIRETLYGVANGLADDASGQTVVAVYAAGVLLGFVATVRAWDRSPAAAMPFVLTASGVVLPFALVAAVSFIKPTLYFRFLIFCVPSLCLFVAGGVTATRMRSIAAVVVAALLIGSGWHTWYVLERLPRFEWRDPATYILARSQPGDALAVRYWQNLLELDYYFERLGMPRGLIEDVFPDWGPDLFIDGKYTADIDAQDFFARHLIAQIDATAAKKKRLWFVLGSEGMSGSFDYWASLPIIQQHLYTDYGSVEPQRIDGFWVFLCSNPRASSPPKR